jgi:hypothetical protein
MHTMHATMTAMNSSSKTREILRNRLHDLPSVTRPGLFGGD